MGNNQAKNKYEEKSDFGDHIQMFHEALSVPFDDKMEIVQTAGGLDFSLGTDKKTRIRLSLPNERIKRTPASLIMRLFEAQIIQTYLNQI